MKPVPAAVLLAASPSSFRWLMLACLIGIFVLVLGALALALVKSHRRQRRQAAAPSPAADPAIRRRMTRGVAVATGVTVVLLLVLLVAGLVRSLPTSFAPVGTDALEVEAAGNQWWWEFGYPGSDPGQPEPAAATAHELHIPVGRPVRIRATSRDVVHGFSVPALNAKADLLPGRFAEVWIQAGEPGTYPGQCAEFCGRQHAHMKFLVVAQPPAEFDAWLAALRRPAPAPDTPLERRGQQVFLSSGCPLCHNVSGTTAGTVAGTAAGTAAGNRIGPDLTHLGSRRTLGGGTRPNDRDHLAAWVVDPQRIKPGNRMPPIPLQPDDLDALLAYLESLR